MTIQLTTLDWIIVAASLVVSFLPALRYARRAGESTAEFFTSGRAAPWWLVGISMVATTFSTDTPNLVTNMVRENGVSDNWLWWAFLLTGMMTVFFFARLWRRSGVLTDLEFYEIRYSGKAAKLLRGFRAVYLGFFFNLVIMATVNLAAAKIGNIVLGWPTGRTRAASRRPSPGARTRRSSCAAAAGRCSTAAASVRATSCTWTGRRTGGWSASRCATGRRA